MTHFLTRWTHFEFWPMEVFYALTLPYGLYLACKAKSLTYFTSVNRHMKYGGAFDTSKTAYARYLPEAVLPVTLAISHTAIVPWIVQQMAHHGLAFPVIIKPDVGERGSGVELLSNKDDLHTYLHANTVPTTLLIQEYLTEPLEYGVFYYKDPDSGKPVVSSVTEKAFFTVHGDGVRTLGEWISQEVRVAHRLGYFAQKYARQWDEVVPQGETMLLEPIGNHSRGTTFIDKRTMITPALTQAMHAIASHLPDLDYCRFDIKVPSRSHLRAGKGIKVLEVNGVNSEPIHIYQPNYPIAQAYRDVFHYMHVIYRISRRNRAKGIATAPWVTFLKDAWAHYKVQGAWSKMEA